MKAKALAPSPPFLLIFLIILKHECSFVNLIYPFISVFNSLTPVSFHSIVSEKLPKNLHAWGFGLFAPFPMQMKIFQRLTTVGLVLSPVLYYNQLAFQVTVHGPIAL